MKKRKTTTFQPLKGKGWVQIPTSDPTYEIEFDFDDFDFPDIANTTNIEVQERYDYDFDNISNNQESETSIATDNELESDIATDNDLFDMYLQAVREKGIAYSQNHKERYRKKNEKEEKFWNENIEFIQKKYLKYSCGGNYSTILNCKHCKMELVARHKCADCEQLYCSLNCFQLEHEKLSFHSLKDWNSDIGWIDTYFEIDIEICSCDEKTTFNRVAVCSLNGYQTYNVKGCVAHVLDSLLSQGYFPGNPLEGHQKIFCFKARFDYSL